MSLRHPACSAKKYLMLNWLLFFVPIAIGLEFLRPESHGLIFVAACLAIVPLAGWLGRATEHLAAHTGEGVGGLLNATFGNAAELIIAIMALRKGLYTVVKASLTGSIIGNILSRAGGGGSGRRYEAQGAGIQCDCGPRSIHAAHPCSYSHDHARGFPLSCRGTRPRSRKRSESGNRDHTFICLYRALVFFPVHPQTTFCWRWKPKRNPSNVTGVCEPQCWCWWESPRWSPG